MTSSLLPAIFVVVLATVLAYVFRRDTQRPSRKKVLHFQAWKPVQFTYPVITPYPSDPLKVRPIPYRPFQSGEYHVTMGIRTMVWDEWIEVDSDYPAYHRIRSHRINSRGTDLIRIQPDNPGVVGSGAEAAIELVHELAEYLSRRFPTIFEVTRHDAVDSNGWCGLPGIKTIKILPFNESYDLPHDIGDGHKEPRRALEIASYLIQEDLAIMIEGVDGRYYFQAGSILVPGFWRIQDKIGMPLEEIHVSGKVPRYQEKLQISMERYFKRLSVDKPVARNNYFFQLVRPPVDGVATLDPEELAWAETSNGPEEIFKRTHSVQQPTRPKVTPSVIRLRTERQTLRRLPQTGAIVFTIRTYLTPVERFRDEPGVAKRLAGALEGWGDDIGEYKGKETGGWWDVLMEYLDQCSDEQAGEGEAAENKYPF